MVYGSSVNRKAVPLLGWKKVFPHVVAHVGYLGLGDELLAVGGFAVLGELGRKKACAV